MNEMAGSFSEGRCGLGIHEADLSAHILYVEYVTTTTIPIYGNYAA